MSTAFYDLHKSAVSRFKPAKDGKFTLNFKLRKRIKVAELESGAISDVTAIAQKWRARDLPPELYINHGMYFKDGIDHIIRELRNKPTSNRALYSLLSQDQISNSGDSPIPSFLLLQCGVVGPRLYATAYFRALEVTAFLKINLEEIRLTLIDICHGGALQVSDVELTIFAFRAYVQSNISTLAKPRLDLLPGDDIVDILRDRPIDMADLIREKARDVTVSSPHNLQEVRRIMETKGSQLAPSVHSRINRLLNVLGKCVSSSEKLATLRKSDSHGQETIRAIQTYVTQMEVLAKEFAQCH